VAIVGSGKIRSSFFSAESIKFEISDRNAGKTIRLMGKIAELV
jgi:hypothetical protein